MKKIFFLFFCLGFLTLYSQDERLEFLSNFLVGDYDMIGKYPDGMLFTGTVSLRLEKSKLIYVRKFGDTVLKEPVSFEYRTADSVVIAVIRYTVEDIHYRTEYMIHSDTGNYPRLTGKIYSDRNGSETHGIEALFFRAERK